MQDSLDITTIIFLALAVFVIWRLRSVLGQKTGAERPPMDPFRREPPPGPRGPARPGDPDNVVRLPGAAAPRATISEAPADRWKDIAPPGSPLASGLDEVARGEPSFEPQGFLNGARMAYEMIVTAFATGDRKTLQDLLSREVYEGFQQAIAERETRGEKAETTFVSIDRSEIVSADVRAGVAQLTVRFASKLITVTRDAAGKVVDGSADAVADVTDVWTFARTLGSRDPKWQLVATESGQ
jgi:predicted lipid-binding transport protein (Tim44 family)